jgi:nitroreductase
MDLYRGIVDKRDRRHFLPQPLPAETLRRILQAGRMAGSSKNSQPNRFVVVQERERVQALADLMPLGRWLATAAAVVVIVQEGREHPFDAGRAAQNMMLAAFGEGVGSCPAHLPEAAVAIALEIPDGLYVNRVIGFGYVDPERDSPPPAVARKRLPLEEIVHYERW